MKKTNNPMDSIFKGGVTERIIEQPKEISQIKRNGLPSPAPTWRGKSLASQASQGSKTLIPKPTYSKSTEQLSSPSLSTNNASNVNSINNVNMINMEIDNDASMRLIMSMSPQELLEAQRELTATFKPKNLEFLKKMAAKKNSSGVIGINKDAMNNHSSRISTVDDSNTASSLLNSVKTANKNANDVVSSVSDRNKSKVHFDDTDIKVLEIEYLSLYIVVYVFMHVCIDMSIIYQS